MKKLMRFLDTINPIVNIIVLFLSAWYFLFQKDPSTASYFLLWYLVSKVQVEVEIEK